MRTHRYLLLDKHELDTFSCIRLYPICVRFSSCAIKLIRKSTFVYISNIRNKMVWPEAERKILLKRNERMNGWSNAIDSAVTSHYCISARENASLNPAFCCFVQARRALTLLRLYPHGRIAWHEVRMKFFPLKCYLYARRRRIPVGWPITKESTANNWISLVEQRRIPEGEVHGRIQKFDCRMKEQRRRRTILQILPQRIIQLHIS